MFLPSSLGKAEVSGFFKYCFINATLVFFFLLQITLALSKRTGLTVELKLVMCLQVRGDFHNRCSGTIRYVCCVRGNNIND